MSMFMALKPGGFLHADWAQKSDIRKILSTIVGGGCSKATLTPWLFVWAPLQWFQSKRSRRMANPSPRLNLREAALTGRFFRQ